MRDRGLLIIKVRPHIADVRIRQADNLSRVARVGKDFLVAGETGVENDFAAAPGGCPRGASSKYSSVFECKNALPYDSFCQRILSLAGSTRSRTLRGFIYLLRRKPEWNRNAPPANMRTQPYHK